MFAWRTFSLAAAVSVAVAMMCCAQDSYIVLDRAYYRGLFLVNPAGAITSLTPAVPWQVAHSLARDTVGNHIVTVMVSDAYGNSNGVYRVTPAGKIAPVVLLGQLARPRGIAIDAAGRYLVANVTSSGVGQLLRISPAGQVEVLFQGEPLEVPTGIALDRQGHCIITDAMIWGRNLLGYWGHLNYGAAYRFDPSTGHLTTVCSSVDENGNVSDDNWFGELVGIAVDADGNFVIVEDLDPAFRLLRIRPNGEVLQRIPLPNLDGWSTVARAVAIDGRGDYIVADALGPTNDKGRLLRVTPAGVVTAIVTSTNLGAPGGVVILSTSPPPAQPEITGMSLVPGTDPRRIRFSWKSELGQQYRIQSAASLAGNSWQDFPFPISGTGDFVEFSEQCDDAEPVFYRIRLIK